MKSIIKNLFCYLLLLGILFYIFLWILLINEKILSENKIQNSKLELTKVENIKIENNENNENNNWDLFVKALIIVESENNINVTNKKTGAFGLFQILPIGGYLCEYNRLKNENIKIEDLKDNEKLQYNIFNYIQKIKNPNKDFKKCLMIHNPTAMNKNYMTNYEYKVMYNYYKLKYENK